jgi:hypothetical protein
MKEAEEKEEEAKRNRATSSAGGSALVAHWEIKFLGVWIPQLSVARNSFCLVGMA